MVHVVVAACLSNTGKASFWCEFLQNDQSFLRLHKSLKFCTYEKVVIIIVQKLKEILMVVSKVQTLWNLGRIYAKLSVLSTLVFSIFQNFTVHLCLLNKGEIFWYWLSDRFPNEKNINFDLKVLLISKVIFKDLSLRPPLRFLNRLYLPRNRTRVTRFETKDFQEKSMWQVLLSEGDRVKSLLSTSYLSVYSTVSNQTISCSW